VSIVKRIPHYSTKHCPHRQKRLMDPVCDFVRSQLYGDDGEGDGGSSCQGAPWELISQVLSSGIGGDTATDCTDCTDIALVVLILLLPGTCLRRGKSRISCANEPSQEFFHIPFQVNSPCIPMLFSNTAHAGGQEGASCTPSVVQGCCEERPVG
jgi:hypothetical protein